MSRHGLRLNDPALRERSPVEVDELLLLDVAGVAERVALRPVIEGTAAASGTADGWEVQLRLEPLADMPGGWSARLSVVWQGADRVERGLRLPVRLGADADPTFLIPGCFYGENRSERCARRFPRYDRLGGDPADMVAASWAFRADRAAVPFVMGRTARGSAAIGWPDGDPPEGAGLGFAAVGPGRRSARPEPGAAPREGLLPDEPWIWVDLPAREEPVSYDGGGEARPAIVRLLEWQPGQQRTMRLVLVIAGPERTAYALLLRAMERHGAEGWAPAPWVDAAGAARLAATGLLRWHLRPDPAILQETAAFDRDLAGRPIVGEDRPNMHVAWLSGTPCAGPLLAWGRRTGDASSVQGALAVLDHIATGLSPSGLFWGEWRQDRGWSGGWNPSSGWIHVRTAGEATLFLGRALAAETAVGATHPGWQHAWRANLDAAVGIASSDGRLATYVDGATGRVMERDGTGALIWIPALLEAADQVAATGDDAAAERWRDAARRAGHAYQPDVLAEQFWGAPEDVHLAPSSEDGYGALMAYTALAERAGDRTERAGWLDLARRAAEWTMTFRLTHDTRWPEPTILSTYGIRTRGMDIASPSNQHLHAYGLVCVPEQLRLARMLDDPWLRRRARDHVLAWRQLIVRADGDLGGRQGMVTERVYHTDCFGPKGAILPLSHAWCLGLILGAALHELDHPEEHVDA